MQTLTAETSLASANDALESILRATSDDELCRALNRWGTAPPMGVFAIGPGLVHEDMGLFRLYDSAEPPGNRWPYLARLRFSEGGWRLQSILSQCTSCFGAGLVEPEDTPCGTCLARGWGVIGSTDYSLAATARLGPGSVS